MGKSAKSMLHTAAAGSNINIARAASSRHGGVLRATARSRSFADCHTPKTETGFQSSGRKSQALRREYEGQ
jgi:hypothetical protein